MMANMMEQLQSMKQKMDETKQKLETIVVEGEAGGGAVKVKVNGNRVIKNISIDPMLLDSEKEEIEDLVLTATNRALLKAEEVHELEMQHSARTMMPGLNL